MESMGSWRDQVDPTPLFFPKSLQDRWYRNHSRAMEDVWVVKLRSGRLGTIARRVAVSTDREALIDFCLTNHVTGATVMRLALPEGTRIHRLPPRRR
jgi:hypothetical protein